MLTWLAVFLWQWKSCREWRSPARSSPCPQSVDKILSPQIRFVFKLQTYDFGLNLIKDHDTRLRKSSMSLSRNIDKWTVTMPGCTMYICILLWLVTDTRFWLAIYETHPNITSDSLHKDPHLRDTGNIPLPAPPPRPLPILVLRAISTWNSMPNPWIS